jgi:hypothetical protein
MDWLQHLPTATWSLCAACLALGWVAGYSFADARTARAGAAAVSSSNRAEEEDSIYDSSNSVSEVKMVLCVRQDLKMTKGKIAAQCGHAALGMYMKFQQREATLMQNWYGYKQALRAFASAHEFTLFSDNSPGWSILPARGCLWVPKCGYFVLQVCIWAGQDRVESGR